MQLMLLGTYFVVVTIVCSILATVPGLPFFSSLNQTLTMVFECFLWWMSHNDSVCTLCWELLSSESFFSRAASEKADILTRLQGGGERPPRFSQICPLSQIMVSSAGFFFSIQKNQKPCGYFCVRVFVLTGRSASLWSAVFTYGLLWI